ERQLDQKCQQISMICQSVELDTTPDGTVQVWLSSRYGGAVEAAMGSSGAKQLSYLSRDMAGDVDQLLTAIATVGKTTQVPIELYRADGIHIGRYEPEARGYIQSHLTLSENPVTLLSSDETR
ncbi:MAG: hypothetical protein F6K16_42160, partial [Symploca sp. SIO2B6]|nr:hypothetical protein [Symploca sp. SIO2B6]